MLKLNDMGAIRVSRSDVWRSQLSHVWLGSCHSAPRHRDCGREDTLERTTTMPFRIFF
jgi:hypothetical protein